MPMGKRRFQSLTRDSRCCDPTESVQDQRQRQVSIPHEGFEVLRRADEYLDANNES